MIPSASVWDMHPDFDTRVANLIAAHDGDVQAARAARIASALRGPGTASFDPDALDQVGDAFTAACRRLGLDPFA